MDPTPAIVDSLDLQFAYQVVNFINDCRERLKLPIVATSGLRTLAEQQALLRAGRTTTLQSKHLKGLAVDVDLYGQSRDAVPAAVWQQIGPLGETFGLVWGGRWKSFRDVGHFESAV